MKHLAKRGSGSRFSIKKPHLSVLCLLRRSRLSWILFVTASAGSGVYLSQQILNPLVFYSHWRAICWPLDGLLVGVLLMRPLTEWVWILFGYVLASFPNEIAAGQPWRNIIMHCVCNVLEITIAAGFLPRCQELTAWLRHPRLIFRFSAFSLVGAPLLSATAFSTFTYYCYGNDFWRVIWEWMPGNMLGIALFSPLVLALRSRKTYNLFRPAKLVQSAILFSTLLIVSWTVFHQTAYPAAFLAFAVLAVVVDRLGFAGAVLGVSVLTVVATRATIMGAGPFMLIRGQYEPNRFAALQVYLTVAVAMCFSIAVKALEREDLQEQLMLALGQMELLATRDGLTGLGNRRLFDASLEKEWSRAKRDRRSIGVILLDADNFKAYNDLYGHLAGDECLCAIATTMASRFQRSGDLAARYGGEEFVVLLPDARIDQVMILAEAIRAEVEALDMCHAKNPAGCVTVSIGCNAVVPYDDISSGQLIASADEALYRAKQGGRNLVMSAGYHFASVSS